MHIQLIPIFQDNYIWLIINSEQKSVIAIDPGDAEPLIDFLRTNQMRLEAILITHHHDDHTGGLLELQKHFLVDVYGPKSERISGVTHQVSEADLITLPSVKAPINILDIPGHTLGHIAYYMPGFLFCGDTLFSAGCGRIFEGTPEQMYHSLQKISALPDNTNIYCTHEYTLQNLKFAQAVEPSNQQIQAKLHEVMALRGLNTPTLPAHLWEEKQINPFLRCHISEIVQHVETHFGLKCSTEVQVFEYLREWKNHFTG